VSLPSGAGNAKASKVIEENLEWLKNFDEIVLFMDADEEGREATKAFADLLPGKCLVAQYPDGYKDANALLVDKREADIKTAYWNAVTADVDNDLMDFGDFTLESLKEEPKVGHPLPFPGMQDAMRGFRKGEVTLFAAGTGIGKSTLTREIGYHLAHVTGLRVCNVYMEEQHQTSWKGYYALHNKIPLVEIEENPDLITEEGYQEASKLFGNNLVIAKNSVEWEHGKLLSKLESLAKSKKCDFIILDHISIAIAGMETDNEARAIEEFMKHLYKLANRTNVGILTVVHLRKAENDKDWSEGLVPKKNHLKGSSALGQYSHNIFVASRDETDEDERYITYLWQLKCRSYSKYNNQCTDALRFNFDTGRLDPTAKFPDKSSEPTKKAKAKPDHGFTPVNNQDF
jgi:twinkle protein